MKILILLPESPYPWASTASRYYGPLLRALDASGHEISVLYLRTRSRGPEEPASYFAETNIAFTSIDPPEPSALLERKLRSAWRADWELSASQFGRTARSLAQRGVDVIFAEHLSTGRAVEGFRNVVCSVQCLRHVDLQAGNSLTDRRRSLIARRAERMTIDRIGRIRVVTRRLADLTRALAPAARVSVVPLCIDAGLYDPVGPPRQPAIGFIGSMFWEPSRAAARRFVSRIVPLIRQEMPGVRCLVAGWDASRYLREECEIAGVEIIEDVRDPRVVFEQLSVLVNAATVGTGMKVKVLEAMAYGVPVVANAEGAEGLEWDREAPISHAEHDAQIAAAAVALARDCERRRAIAAAGRACVERSFAPAVVAPRLVIELRNLLAPERCLQIV